jgi:hypothetical protein
MQSPPVSDVESRAHGKNDGHTVRIVWFVHLVVSDLRGFNSSGIFMIHSVEAATVLYMFLCED